MVDLSISRNEYSDDKSSTFQDEVAGMDHDDVIVSGLSRIDAVNEVLSSYG